LSPPFKSSPVEFKQSLLFPANIFDLLPDDHECYVYAGLFEQLNTVELESQYSVLGQHAYHPKLIVSILIYAYSRGVFSARQIEKRCNEDLSFMYIAQRNCPNFRVLNDFRKDHAEYFQACFIQTVRLAIELGLASLGHISLDGSKFKASSSKHKAMSYQRLKEAEATLMAEIDALIQQANQCDEEEDRRYKDRTGFEIPEDLKFKETRLEKIKAARQAIEDREQTINPGKAIDGKKQISFADKDARIMGKRGGAFEYAYNGQISVDKDNQIIVGQHVSQQANDQQEVEPALENLQVTTGRLPSMMSLDNGYMSGTNLEALEKAGVDAYIATDRGEKPGQSPLDESTRKLVKADFAYDASDDSFTCPGGQKLPLVKKGTRDRVYQGDVSICEPCEYKDRCCQSSNGQARTINTDDKEEIRQRMNKKMQQADAKEVYGHRKTIVEPKFGHIKNGGFRGFSLRGMKKVAGEFSLVCAVHNIKKIVKSKIVGQIPPEIWNRAIMAT
jgi:transposase